MVEPPLHACIIAYEATTIPSLPSMIAREFRAARKILCCSRATRHRVELIGIKIMTACCFLLQIERSVMYQKVVEAQLGL